MQVGDDTVGVSPSTLRRSRALATVGGHSGNNDGNVGTSNSGSPRKTTRPLTSPVTSPRPLSTSASTLSQSPPLSTSHPHYHQHQQQQQQQQQYNAASAFAAPSPLADVTSSSPPPPLAQPLAPSLSSSATAMQLHARVVSGKATTHGGYGNNNNVAAAAHFSGGALHHAMTYTQQQQQQHGRASLRTAPHDRTRTRLQRWLDEVSITHLLLAGALLRIVFIAYSFVHDRYFDVKYTDIDYMIILDGARAMARGLSPFERTTYRYTPLLAAMVLPAALVASPLGKMTFAAADLYAAWYSYTILCNFSTERSAKLVVFCFILANPIVLNVSTRGNSDMLLTSMCMAMLAKFYERRYAATAAILGFAVHFKLYPIIYTLPLVACLWARTAPRAPLAHRLRRCTLICVLSVVCFTVAFAVPTLLCYALYGQQYLHEAFFYHFRREDHRHNLSPHWLLMYLNMARRAIVQADAAAAAAAAAAASPLSTTTPSVLTVGASHGSGVYVSTHDYSTGMIAFLPQFVALVWVSWRLRRNIAHACCVVTMLFVAFNKVCTVQYFVWFVPFLVFVFAHPRPRVAGRGMMTTATTMTMMQQQQQQQQASQVSKTAAAKAGVVAGAVSPTHDAAALLLLPTTVASATAMTSCACGRGPPRLVTAAVAATMWSCTIPLWLIATYQLEYRRHNHFGLVWLTSCIFFLATVGFTAWLARICRSLQTDDARLDNMEWHCSQHHHHHHHGNNNGSGNSSGRSYNHAGAGYTGDGGDVAAYTTGARAGRATAAAAYGGASGSGRMTVANVKSALPFAEVAAVMSSPTDNNDGGNDASATPLDEDGNLVVVAGSSGSSTGSFHDEKRLALTTSRASRRRRRGGGGGAAVTSAAYAVTAAV